MNDHTPRKFSGSLLERAVDFYAYAPSPPRAAATAPTPVVETSVPDVMPVADAVPARRFVPVRRRAVVDREALAERGMILPGGAITILAEEFRLVKRALLGTMRDIASDDADRARTILVGSARPNDGKTFCAINLALSLAAERDLEILLVDADFAKPDVLATLGIEDSAGLLDALADPTIDVEALVVETDVPHLTLLPAGGRTIADTELLGSQRARDVIAGLVADNPNRVVIFDTPPALAASPASVLAGLVGQVLMVVRADKTTEGDLRGAVALLDGCEHLQLMLNAVSLDTGKDRFGSYYQEGMAE
ncbi:AAA family ATPase [Sphingomonas sp. AX6]|uniref:AAA family ATPase n=1 Tax=Sphingomonas sp. AX6 TaxID=2653171 RepID=UPI0012F07ADB|nr:AAA family ATPase [Sphingomonas sp. AX6]VXC92011.1 Exopolysaccharide biosynthesis protein [Sphingomonas sp. AX6]